MKTHSLAGFAFLLAVVLALDSASADVFTPVTASTLSPEARAIRGTDGVYHVVYELQLTNTRSLPATIRSIDVLSGTSGSEVTTSFAGADLLKRLRTLAPQPAKDAMIEPNAARLVYIELTFSDAAHIPKVLEHRLHLIAALRSGTAEQPLEYVVAALKIVDDKPLIIGPPLAGAGWVAANGCCNPGIVHRGSVLSVNGALYNAQRFAIDWMRLDEQGRLVHGDLADVHNYSDYGADVLAVADARVVSTFNNLDDQIPGHMPDPSTINIDNVDGNHVVLDLGGGRFAFYAHLQKNSVRVKPGDEVKRGAVLGKLGNTGNSSAPHLHFHVMTSPSVLGSDGVPYLIGAFDFAGQVDIAAFEAAPDITGDWGKGRLAKPERRKREFPLNADIINFAAAAASR